MRFVNTASLATAIVGLLVLGFPLWPAGSRGLAQNQNQNQSNRQRPRRVAESDQGSVNANKSSDNGQSSGSAEEIDEGDVVRVDTKRVSVPAVITNGAGRPLVGLRRENFVVFEDGQPQSIANFGTTEAPFEIALLLDTSGSTRDDVALIRQAANSFIAALRPSDRVAVTAFNTERNGNDISATVDDLSPLTGDRVALQKAISNLGSANGTPFYDALDRVAREIFRETASE